MNTYEKVRAILAEIDHVLARVDEKQITQLCDAVQNARHIFIHGLGREGLVMRAFAMRLMHLGLKVAVVGDVTTPPIGPGDLFLASCGPGHLATVQALMEIARRAGGQVAVMRLLKKSVANWGKTNGYDGIGAQNPAGGTRWVSSVSRRQGGTPSGAIFSMTK
jgi:6-phospho 3-hexuloisomerase